MSDKLKIIMILVVAWTICYPILLKADLEPSKPYYQLLKPNNDYQNKIVKIASEISDNNLDFLATIYAENRNYNPYAVGYNKNGTTDHLLCQINSKYHKDFIESDKAYRISDQVEYCLDIFNRRPGAFYGYYIREKFKPLFIFNS